MKPGTRPWTKREIHRLYQYAEKTSQKVAAKKLKRSYRSVRAKAASLGIVWGQGFVGSQAIANAAGCSQKQARMFIEKLYPDGVPGYGEGAGYRYKIPEDEADYVIRVLKQRLRRYNGRIAPVGGRDTPLQVCMD